MDVKLEPTQYKTHCMLEVEKCKKCQTEASWLEQQQLIDQLLNQSPTILISDCLGWVFSF